MQLLLKRTMGLLLRLLRRALACLFVVGTVGAAAQDEENKVQWVTVYSSTNPSDDDPENATVS